MGSARTAEPARTTADRNPAAAILSRAPVREAASVQSQSPASSLQRRLGNRSTVALMRSAASATAMAPTPGLKVSSPSDPAEREAVSVAASVMRSETSGVAMSAIPMIQRAPSPAPVRGGGAAPAKVTAQIARSMSGGTALPQTVRTFMEPRFGADFGSVRIHTGENAAEMNSALNARAFTVGNHVFFGRNQFQPSARDGKTLIAHELTHTIQQGHGARRSIQREGGDDFLSGMSKLLDGLSPEGAVKLAISTVAPGLNPIIQQGGLKDMLAEQALAAVDNVFASVRKPLDAMTGAGEQVAAAIGPIIETIQTASAQIAKNDCSPIRAAAEKIEQIAMKLITPVVELVQPVIAGIKKFLDDVWKKIGAPIVDWIKEYAAEQWRLIKMAAGLVQDAAVWLWDKTAGLREPYIQMWNMLKNWLGIGDSPDGRNGILQWVEQKLTDAWNAIKLKLAPYTDQLKTVGAAVGAVLLALSPVGPMVALGAAAIELGKGISWVAANWGKGNIMATARAFVEKTLIPPLASAIDKVTASVTGIANSISASLTGLAASLAKTAAVVGGTAIGFIIRLTQWLSDQAQALASYVNGTLGELKLWLGGAFDKLSAFLRRVMNFLSRVGDVIIDIYGLPVLLGEAIWNAVPQCIRDPIVDFLGPIILRQIELFSELVKDDDAWKKTKEEVGRLIKLVFHNKDLIGAIKAAFLFVLRIFNLPPDLLASVGAKAMAAWDQVMKKPLDFLKSTVKALGQGFKIIWDDKLENIKNGLQGWLLGEIKDKNIIMPTNWTDLGQIFEFVLSILGISVDHVYELLEQRFPGRAQKFRQVMGKITRIMEWVDKSIDVTKSPKDNAAGMLNQAKDFGLSLLESGAEWIIRKVAAKVTEELVKAAATAGFGAILTAAESIYNALVTAKKWMRQILDMANRGLDNIMDLVNGAYEKVGGVFAELMKKGMPVVIGFLADQVGLGDVGRELGKAIDKLRAKVDKALLWIIDKIKAGIDWLIGLGKKAIEKIAGWLGISESFTTEDNEPHRIYLEGSDSNAKIMVASNVISLAKLLETDGDLDREVKAAGTAKKTGALANARLELATANKAKLTLEKKPEDAETIKNLRGSFKKLVGHLAILGVGASKEFPEATFSYQPMGTVAGTATVSKLSKNTPLGQKPAPTIVGWTHVKTFDPEHKYWERVHLVSEFFGGSGANKNLIPARKTDNAWMREGPEATVKAMLEKNMIMHYKATVTGYYQIKDPDNGKPVYGFPTGVKVDISIMKKKGKNWVQDVAAKLYPTLIISPPPPKGNALIDLKTAGAETWRTILGMPSGLARNIAEAKGRAFANEADFLQRMRTFYGKMTAHNKGDFEEYIPEIDRLLGRKSEKARAFF